MPSEPPPEYVCGITKKLMSDPMVSRYGTRFERAAIMNWLDEGNHYCPVTGNPLRPSNLVSDKKIQWEIRYWAKKNHIELEEEKQEKDSSIGFVAVPDQRFICPLTLEVMNEPLVSTHGINFEKKAILKWLDEKGLHCPVTKKPLTYSNLVSNHKLQWEIAQWQLKTGDSRAQMSQLELEGKLTKAVMISKKMDLSDIYRVLTVGEHEPAPPTATEGEQTDVLSVIDDIMGTLA